MWTRRTVGMAGVVMLCVNARAVDVPTIDAAKVVREHAHRAGQTLRLVLPDPGSLSIHPLAPACLRLPMQHDLHLLFSDALISRWTQSGFDKLRGQVQLTVRVREAKFGKNVLADVLDFIKVS